MLQAKKGFGNDTDALQRTLYEHADHFEYRRSTPKLNGQQRMLPGKESLALSYWDIEEDVMFTVRCLRLNVSTLKMTGAAVRHSSSSIVIGNSVSQERV